VEVYSHKKEVGNLVEVYRGFLMKCFTMSVLIPTKWKLLQIKFGIKINITTFANSF
jgi:hypothetical protein